MKKILILILTVLIYISSFAGIIQKIENILKKDSAKIEYLTSEGTKASNEFNKVIEKIKKEKFKSKYFIENGVGRISIEDPIELCAYLTFDLDMAKDEDLDIYMMDPQHLKEMIIERKKEILLGNNKYYFYETVDEDYFDTENNIVISFTNSDLRTQVSNLVFLSIGIMKKTKDINGVLDGTLNIILNGKPSTINFPVRRILQTK